MEVKSIKTHFLRQAYEESGPKRGERVLLLHGWPDSPRTFDKVLPHLHEAGYRTITPYLRGYGPSHFRDRLFGKNPRRTGQPVAYAQDIIDLADRLGLKRFHFVGHDWGAMTGYALAALFPKRLKSLVAISVPFQPGKAKPPAYPQARAFWYQWSFCSKPGEELFRSDPVAYGPVSGRHFAASVSGYSVAPAEPVERPGNDQRPSKKPGQRHLFWAANRLLTIIAPDRI